jgi:hypothetical protein
MRLVLLSTAALFSCVAMIAASSAFSAPKSGGCPATASALTEVSYVTSPSADWQGTSLYTFLFVDTGSGEGTIVHFGLSSEQEAYFAFVEFLEVRIDTLDDDETVCVNWTGGNPGLDDYLINSVDNTANARR